MQNVQKMIVPVAIIIAGGLIAGAIYFSGSNTGAGNTQKNKLANVVDNNEPADIEVAPVTKADHIQGSVNAKVVIIDYSDTECPFCKRFHETLKKIYAEYSKDGKVAWVYRHFPLDMHKKAPKEAEATECANELGGSDMFWKYTETIYANTPANDGLDPAKLITFAGDVGLNKIAFKKCLDSGKYASKVAEAKAAGFKAGARGTPYTVFAVTVDGKTEYVPLVGEDGRGLGALPYEGIKTIVEKLLAS